MKNRDLHPGLSTAEARQRIAEDGPNALPESRRRMIGIVRDTAREPMFLLLLAAALLYLLLGDIIESLMLGAMVSLVIAITLYQEGKTERALEALRDMSSPRALVMRDGQPVRIPGRDVVRGDLLMLVEGDRVAADAVLVQSDQLQVDESLLTGEAWAVRKQAGETDAPPRPGGEDLPWLWSGTLVVQGSGMARVTATGLRSEMGKIGTALQGLVTERSLLQLQAARMVRVLAIGGVALSTLVVLLYGFGRGDWLQAVLAGIALAMSLLPEEYPVILTVFPAIGAWRLARAQMLTRRLSAIETLGSVSVLCTDKTGTLTENRMVVSALFAQGEAVEVLRGSESTLPVSHAEVARFASLASKPEPFDPMEKAFHALATRVGVAAAAEPVHEYGLSSALRAMSVVRREPDGSYQVATKGAPEAIAQLCRLDASALARMREAIDGFAARGLRVLGVARARHAGGEMPQDQHGFQFEYLGLVGLTDPLREEIPDAMRQCAQAGIRVIVITGDYQVTALSIARQAGLPPGEVLSGEEMSALSDDALAQRLTTVNICARITPDQKLRIVEALKRGGAVVAMTGDGVNDAPALKAAHVGIAMGGRGTDVAREAAALVLLDDNFASIVRGIRLGRRIFANVQNAMSYVMSMHVPIAGMALLPVLFGWPVLLLPMHIGFLELIIDPACSLAFENESSEKDAMSRPPRDAQAPLFDRHLLATSLVQGLGAMTVVAITYWWGLQWLNELQARAFGFTALVVANVSLIFATLSPQRSALHVLTSSNRIPLLVSAVALVLLLITLYVPAVAGIFKFAALPWPVLGLAMAAGAASLFWYETVKLVSRYCNSQNRLHPAGS